MEGMRLEESRGVSIAIDGFESRSSGEIREIDGGPNR